MEKKVAKLMLNTFLLDLLSLYSNILAELWCSVIWLLGEISLYQRNSNTI